MMAQVAPGSLLISSRSTLLIYGTGTVPVGYKYTLNWPLPGTPLSYGYGVQYTMYSIYIPMYIPIYHIVFFIMQ